LVLSHMRKFSLSVYGLTCSKILMSRICIE
jgi:hypothetical protein